MSISMSTANATLYEKTIQVSEEFLGPAAERFIRRQISTHLNTEPELLKKSQLPKLTKWATLAFAVLTNNDEDIEDFKESLLALSAQNSE